MSATLTNADSARDVGTFTINTYAVISSVSYAIDTGTFTDVYTPDAALLTATVSAQGSSVAYAETYYELTLIPEKNLPADSIIVVEFPSEITMEDTSISVCKVNLASAGLKSYTSCELTLTSPPTFTIPKAITSAFTADGSKTIIVQVGNVRNPRSTEPTSSFKVYL